MSARGVQPRAELVTKRKSFAPDAIAHARVRAFTCYALSRSAYCTPSTYERLRETMEATVQLDADEGWASRLYAHVQQQTGNDIELSAIEATFHFRWQLVTEHECVLDPYFSRVLEQGITASFGRMLGDLETACRGLPGLDPGEHSLSQDHNARCACNLLYNRLATALVHPDTTQQQLLSIAQTARDELVGGAARAARERIDYQATGVRALQRLCAAVREQRESIAVLVQEMREVIGYLVHNPPAIFASELRQAGVPLVELRAYLYPEGRPLSGAVLEMSVGRWALTYYDAVSSACITTLDALRVMSRTTCNWHGYAGIAMWHRARHADLIKTALATGGVGAAVCFPEVQHLHACNDYVLVATATAEPTALRVVRLAVMVHEMINVGLIRPRVVRADCVLALVGRFGCEASVERDRRLADEAAHAGMEIEEPLPHPVAYPLVPLPPAPHPLPIAAGTPLEVTLHGTSRVSKCLQRDYVIIAVIRDLLSKCHYVSVPGPESDDERVAAIERGFVGITQACEHLNALTGMGDTVQTMVTNMSRPSLTMCLQHLMKDKLVKAVRATEACSDDDVQYTDMPSWLKGSKGMSFTRVGYRLLAAHMDEVLHKMQPPTGAAFAKEWHTSRSSISHARRKQADRGHLRSPAPTPPTASE
jgi:hypothetical protein